MLDLITATNMMFNRYSDLMDTEDDVESLKPGEKLTREPSNGLDMGGMFGKVQDMILNPSGAEMGRKHREHSGEGHIDEQLEKMARIEYREQVDELVKVMGDFE